MDAWRFALSVSKKYNETARNYTEVAMKILQRESGALEHDLSLDGDRVRYILRPLKMLIWSSFFMTPFMLGLLGGGGLWFVLFQKYYFNPRYDVWALYLCGAVPAVGILIGLAVAIPRMFVRYEVSRRYVRVVSGIFIKSVENIDMKRVKDTSLKKYGPFSSLSIVSTDKTMPALTIPFIDADEAAEAFLFINDVAIDSRTELLLATARMRKHRSSDID
jgi:membrane protein YdbS with pleckstrin-like domain